MSSKPVGGWSFLAGGLLALAVGVVLAIEIGVPLLWATTAQALPTITTPSCDGVIIKAAVNMPNPNYGVPDENGVTWTQVGSGFSIATPKTMKLVSGIIHNPIPDDGVSDKPLERAFEVVNSDFGRTVEFSYDNFEMGSSGTLCVTTRT